MLLRLAAPIDAKHLLLGIMAEAMPALLKAQLAGLVNAIEVKSDGSLVSEDDRNLERIIRDLMAAFGLPVLGEELGLYGPENDRYVAIVDPIDGSRPFNNCDMGGSTIIIGIYDKVERRIVAAAIGRPGTRELWLAVDDVTEKYQWLDETNKFKYLGNCRVWTVDPNVSRPTVYVDNPNPFARRGVDMLTDAGLDLFDSLIRKAKLTKFCNGSNGNHHGLVANGGAVVGSITTSVGGVQDLSGVLVVENAGGVVAAFRLTEDRKLVRVDPHAALLMGNGVGYDFLVTAISDEYLWILRNILEASLRQ